MVQFFIAFLAFQRPPDPFRPRLLVQHPLPHYPWRIMPHMLAMPALQLRRPMPRFILIETDYRTLHRNPPWNIY
jgi:hypothetical protein